MKFIYYNKYTDGGFKRLLNEGYSCENTMINYIPAFTGVGHFTIFTGSVSSIQGIAGIDWFDVTSEKLVYCTDDSTVQGVGVSGSPPNPFRQYPHPPICRSRCKRVSTGTVIQYRLPNDQLCFNRLCRAFNGGEFC